MVTAAGAEEGKCSEVGSRRMPSLPNSRELRAVIVSVNYRLAPQHQYLDANALPADVAPYDISSCFSAGGNIAHHVAQRWASMSTMQPVNNLRLSGVVLIQPLFGGEERTRAEMELANACSILTLASADYYWREFLPEGATSEGQCGGTRQGSVEDLLRKNKTVRMVEYADAIHGFYIFPEIADSTKFMADVKMFVQEYT